MGITSSKLPPSTNIISQQTAEPAGVSGSNVQPLSGPAGSSTPGRSQTLPRATDRNERIRFRTLADRINSLGRNNAGRSNRAPIIVDANPPQSPAAVVDQGVEAAPIQHADAASATQAEEAPQHSSADSSGTEPASSSSSLPEAIREFVWLSPLVNDAYRPATGNATPAAETVPTASTANDVMPVFADYGMPSWLDPAVREALQSINPLVTPRLALNTLVTTGTVGPILDKEMVHTFNLALQREHRFVEKEIDGRQRTFVVSCPPGKRWIESVHLVEFEKASTSASGAKQTVTINGVKKTLFVEREQESQQLVRVDTPESRVRARVKAFAKGAQTRAVQQREFQAITPYRNQAHYALATRAFSGKKGVSPERTAQTAGEWNVYRSSRAVSLLKERSAVLHSFRMEGHLEGALAELDAPPDKGRDAVRPLGHIYRPRIAHTMKVNTAWMLGLAHHQIPAVLTTPLTAGLLLRRKRNAEDAQSLSALCRELVGLLQNGYFRVETNRFGKKILVPTPTASAATLESMRVPPKADLDEIIAFLEQNNLPVLTQAENTPGRASRFNAEDWWSALLLDDLLGPDNTFPRLNTLIYSGVPVPVPIFQNVLMLLRDVTSQEFQRRRDVEDSSGIADSMNSQDSLEFMRAVAAKEPEIRIPDLLMVMVNGMTDDRDAKECLRWLVDDLPLFHRTGRMSHVAEKVIDCIHRRAIEIKNVKTRMNLLNRLMHKIIASDVAGTPKDGEDFPLLAHALNARVLNPEYQLWKPEKITDAMYEKLPLEGVLCRTALVDIDTEEHPDSKRAIRLGLKVFDSLVDEWECRKGLSELAYGIRNTANYDERTEFATEVMNRRLLLSSSDQELIAQRVGYSLIWAEVDAGDTELDTIKELLEEFNIPLRRNLAFAAIDEIQSRTAEEQHRQLTLAAALMNAGPQRDNEWITEEGIRKLVNFIESLKFIQPEEIIQPGSGATYPLIDFGVNFIHAYLDELRVSPSTWKEIAEALTMSLIGISTLEPKRAIEILQYSHIPNSDIFEAAFTQLEGSSSPDNAHAMNFVAHIMNTMGPVQRAGALRSLLGRFKKSPSSPGAKEIIETIAVQINASKKAGALHSWDQMHELVCVNLTEELAKALMGANVLQHQNALDMLVAFSSIEGGPKLMDDAFDKGRFRMAGEQKKAVKVIFEQIDRMRTAEEQKTDDPKVQILGYLVESLAKIAGQDANVFNTLQRVLKTAIDAPMTDKDRCYLTQELIDSLKGVSVNENAAEFAFIDRIDRNLVTLKESSVAAACRLSRKLIEAEEDMVETKPDNVEWHVAVNLVANCFDIEIPDSIGSDVANRSAFVLEALAQIEESMGQRMQEDAP